VTDGYFADPLSCTSFIRCFSGIPYKFGCPGVLHYDAELKVTARDAGLL